MTTTENAVKFVDSANDFHKINGQDISVSIKDVTVSFKGSKGTFIGS